VSASAPAPWSLRRRLARRILLATGAIWALTLGVGLAVMWHEMGEVADASLGLQARTIANLVAAVGTAPPDVNDGEFVSRVTPPGFLRNAAPWPPLAADGRRSINGWTVVRKSTSGGVVVEVGQPLEARIEDFLEAAGVWLLLTVPLLGLLLGVVVRTVQASLGPVTRFASEMEQRRASDLSPIPDAGLPVELLPIPRALGRYLGRIEALLHSERSFSANAAHELRTPLAVASAQAQLIAEGRDAPRAARAIVDSVARLTTTVDRLLDLARAESGLAAHGARCDLVPMLRLLVSEAPPGRIRLDDGDFEKLEVGADVDSVALVVGNLLRNALEHGTGPVRVALRPGPCVEVSNAAVPGAAFREDRFATGPHSRGTGLGLSIVRATAERLGWRLDLAVHDDIATATLDLPRPSR